jgi:hypothetical protein
MNIEERIIAEGRPFYLTVSVVAPAVQNDFELDTDTYDTVAGFFEDKMLWVAGMRVVSGPADTVTGVDFDDTLVWANTSGVAGTGIDLSGQYDALLTAVMPKIKDAYGVTWLPVRNRINIYVPGAVGTTTVELWGVYTERTM